MMNFTKQINQHSQEWKWAAVALLLFSGACWLPIEALRFQSGIQEAFSLTQWYAREHVILCLLPAFFIAGSITSFISQGSIIRYLSHGSNRFISYAVASVSGSILAVCSCTVLPLFAGIYRMGAGLGPATCFLYSGPAISALAIIMSAKVLGIEMGLARGIGAVVFSVIIGVIMAAIFKKDNESKKPTPVQIPEENETRPLRQTILFLTTQIIILIFANWQNSNNSFFSSIFIWKWWGVSATSILLAWILYRWFDGSLQKILITSAAVLAAGILWGATPAFSIGLLGLVWITAGKEDALGEWWRQTWSFAKMILPLLLAGVFITGLLVGRPDHEAWIPTAWMNTALGGDGILPIFCASFAGSLMYFATLTEIPIVEALQGAGMKQGASLALLLAGPALSLPNMLVIRSILGTKKALTYISLVILFSTLAGWSISYFI